MAGVKQFLPHDAVAASMRVFWLKGYPSTSLSDLEEATGLNRSSLYATFGSKEDIFVACLSQYGDLCAKDAFEALQDPDIRQAIGGMLRVRAKKMTDPKMPNGCLFLSLVVDQEALPQNLKAAAKKVMREIEDHLYERLLRGQREGQISTESDPRQLARFFLSIFHGMSAVSTTDNDERTLNDIIDAALLVIPA